MRCQRDQHQVLCPHPACCWPIAYKRNSSVSPNQLRASWHRPDVSNPAADHRIAVASSPAPPSHPKLAAAVGHNRLRCLEALVFASLESQSTYLDTSREEVEQQDAAHCRWHWSISGQLRTLGDCSNRTRPNRFTGHTFQCILCITMAEIEPAQRLFKRSCEHHACCSSFI
jgi:hypothetical protein